MRNLPAFEVPGPLIAFQRWDKLEHSDAAEIVVFLAAPDVLSGLFTLANFDEDRPGEVVTVFGSGCASIVCHPYQELRCERPRAVLGMFDVSARPCVAPAILSFAVPWPEFADMVRHVDEGFLITRSRHRVRTRL